LYSICKDYGSKALIPAKVTITSNNIGKDIIPSLSLDYDCFLSEERSTELNRIHLDLTMKSVVNHLDYLKLANYRVEEVERLISAEELKLKHSNIDYPMSSLSYVGTITTCLILVFFFFSCYYCRYFRRRCPDFSKWWKDNSPCTTIMFKLKMVSSIHSSRESLQFPSSRPSIKHRRSQNDCQEMTALASLTASAKHIGPSAMR
jgi:hypothetical protein